VSFIFIPPFPIFIFHQIRLPSPSQDNLDVPEAGKVHFDCRLEPKSDPTMRIDWFFNGRPFATGSRVKTVYDFGFISLDMDYVYARDSGEYICRATNKWGTAMTKAKVICKGECERYW
jgi:Immunoglobulin I-set domain.